MYAAIPRSETHARATRMLRTALGPAIAGFLDDAAVVEVMLNPDGQLWLDRLGIGLQQTGCALSPEDGERIVRLVAHHLRHRRPDRPLRLRLRAIRRRDCAPGGHGRGAISGSMVWSEVGLPLVNWPCGRNRTR